MSTSSKADNAANPKQGAFKPSAPRGDTIATKGHQLGRKVNEAEQHSEYHAQAFPSGSAPASKSHAPNTVSEIPVQGNNPNMGAGQKDEATYTPAVDTLKGATSGDMNRGLGRPIQGQSSTELRHDGKNGRKKGAPGLEGVRSSMQDEGQFMEQRGLE